MTDHIDIDGLPIEDMKPSAFDIFLSIAILVARFVASFSLVQRGGPAR